MLWIMPSAAGLKTDTHQTFNLLYIKFENWEMEFIARTGKQHSKITVNGINNFWQTVISVTIVKKSRIAD